MVRATGSPASQTSVPAVKRSGQSVSSSMRTPPRSPFGPRTRATARRRSLGVGDDLELDMAPVSGGHDAEKAADRVGDPAVAADHASHVLLIDSEGQDGLVTVVLDLDYHRIGLVDERARDVLEELLHASAFSPSSVASAAASGSGAGSGSADGSASAAASAFVAA